MSNTRFLTTTLIASLALAACERLNDAPQQPAKRYFDTVGQQGHQPQQSEDAPYGPEFRGVVIARFEYYRALFTH